MQTYQQEAALSDTQLLTKALFNVKKELNLSNDTIGQIIGADAATISRMHKKMDMKQSKVFEAAVLFIRSYRSLYAILGGSLDAMHHWLNTQNVDFQNKPPIENMKTLVGLVNTVEYLDAVRGHV